MMYTWDWERYGKLMRPYPVYYYESEWCCQLGALIFPPQTDVNLIFRRKVQITTSQVTKDLKI